MIMAGQNILAEQVYKEWQAEDPENRTLLLSGQQLYLVRVIGVMCSIF